MEIQLIDNSVSDCSNPGLACLGCPNYDVCEHHYDTDTE